MGKSNLEKLEAIAKKLDGVEYRDEDKLIDQLYPQGELRDAGIVIVFGASDDLVELRGAVNQEIDAWEGGLKKVSHYLKFGKTTSFIIDAKWLASGLSPYPCWSMRPVDFEFSTFEIFERGKVYCIGAVFCLDEALADADSEPEPEKKRVEIVTNGAGEFKEYRLMLVDGSELFSMFFDSAAAALAYGEKQGYSVVPFLEPAAAPMEKLYTPAEIADQVGCSAKWIHRLAPELIEAGMAQRVGRVLVLVSAAVVYMNNRPDGRRNPSLK